MKPDVADEFQMVYQEIDGLVDRINKLEEAHGGIDIKTQQGLAFFQDNPVPQCETAIAAMEEADEEVDALYENLFTNAAMEYVSHYLKFKPETDKWTEDQIRGHFHDSYILHAALIDSYEQLID